PREIERLVKRCLRKDPAQRFQHMDDLNVALEELKQESDSGELAEAVGAGLALAYKRVVAPLAGFIIIPTILLVSWLTHRTPVSPPQPLQPKLRQITFVGDASIPAISPDGSFVAYVVGREGSRSVQISECFETRIGYRRSAALICRSFCSAAGA